MVLWDNSSVLHQATTDYDMTEYRYLYRVLLGGETPIAPLARGLKGQHPMPREGGSVSTPAGRTSRIPRTDFAFSTSFKAAGGPAEGMASWRLPACRLLPAAPFPGS